MTEPAPHVAAMRALADAAREFAEALQGFQDRVNAAMGELDAPSTQGITDWGEVPPHEPQRGDVANCVTCGHKMRFWVHSRDPQRTAWHHVNVPPVHEMHKPTPYGPTR